VRVAREAARPTSYLIFCFNIFFNPQKCTYPMMTFLDRAKYFLASLFVFFTAFSLDAAPVSQSQAELVGRNFFAYHAGLSPQEAAQMQLQLLHRATSVDLGGQTLYYVFNIDGNKGFVMVSGDDVAFPVLGYSDEAAFPADFAQDMPPHVQKWFDSYGEQIQTAAAQAQVADAYTRSLWDKYSRYASPEPNLRATVPALMSTRWNQSPHYNALCPYDNTYNARTVSGCVATAASQIMKYHAYPAQGTGFHSYNHLRYGTLSANFGTASYNWAAMPNTVSSANTGVATMTYHVGVAMDMNYNVSSQGGSGAYVISAASPVTHCAEYALRTYFGYDATTLQGLRRSSYTYTAWLNLLKNDLNNNRPILYAGFGTGGGHAFVADGYNSSDQFHFNWGWGGSYDGYFQLDALNPSGTGIGGGSGGYNSNQQALIGIKPPAGSGGGGTPPVSNVIMNLQQAISVSPSTTIPFGQSFTVTTNFVNNGTSNFSGDIAACLFDNSGNFIDYIETKTNRTLTAGFVYSTAQTFTNATLRPTPGSYRVGFYTRNSGSTSWNICGGAYSNPINITIQAAQGAFELYSNIVASPNPLRANSAATITFDVANRLTTAFNGKISIDLHDRSGNFLRTIEEKTGLSLCANCHFTNGLTFNTSSLDAEAGTYLLVAWMQPTGGSWQVIGSTTNYSNYVEVVVQAAGLSPDIYESNNTAATAYPLSLTFSGSSASRKTTSSNTHIGSDEDYYSFYLPTGYTYTLNPRLHDSYNSGDGQTYTNDALFSYSTNGGQTYSSTYDHVLPNSLTLQGGTTVIFKVASYFQGTTGTYILDVAASRSVASSVGEITDNMNLKIYPNPADNQLFISCEQPLQTAQLYDALGRQIADFTPLLVGQTMPLQLSVADIANGVYFLRLTDTEGKQSSQQIRVQR